MTPRTALDLEQAVQPLGEEIRAQVEAVTATRSEWRDRLRAAVYTVLRFLQENPSAARLIFVDLLAAGERGVLRRDRGMEAAIDLIDEGRAHVEPPSRVTRATAEALAGGAYSCVADLVERGDFDALEEAVPKLLYVTVLPYLGTEAAMEELQMSRGYPSPSGSGEGKR